MRERELNIGWGADCIKRWGNNLDLCMSVAKASHFRSLKPQTEKDQGTEMLPASALDENNEKASVSNTTKSRSQPFPITSYSWGSQLSPGLNELNLVTHHQARKDPHFTDKPAGAGEDAKGPVLPDHDIVAPTLILSHLL